MIRIHYDPDRAVGLGTCVCAAPNTCARAWPPPKAFGPSWSAVLARLQQRQPASHHIITHAHTPSSRSMSSSQAALDAYLGRLAISACSAAVLFSTTTRWCDLQRGTAAPRQQCPTLSERSGKQRDLTQVMPLITGKSGDVALPQVAVYTCSSFATVPVCLPTFS